MSTTTHRSPNVVGGLLGFASLLVILVPIYYIVITSVRPREDYYSSNPLSLPSEFTLEPFRYVLENEFLRYVANSVFVTVLTVVAVVAASLLASYVIVRSRTRLARFSQKLFLMGIAIPIQATIKIGRASCREREYNLVSSVWMLGLMLTTN